MVLRNHTRKIGLFAWGMFLLAVMLLLLTELPKVPLGMIALSFIGLALLTMRNHTRRIGSTLLLIACVMFTVHTASAGEILSPRGLSPAEQRLAFAKPGETITVDGIVCEVTLVEAKGAGSPRNIIRPMARRAELVTTLSDRVTRLYIRRFNNTRNLSVATSPEVRLMSHQKGKYVTTDTEIPGYEITLIPALHENGIIFTSIVVKRTETHDGKEKAYQWETSNSLPTGSRSSLLASSRLGGKEFALLVTAQKGTFDIVIPTMEEMEKWSYTPLGLEE